MSTLIRVIKNGESLSVHPTTVEAHKRAGWAVSADQTDADDAPAAPLDDAKSPAEVLAMADDKAVPFMTFKSAASKLLGDACSAKKDEIIAALMEPAPGLGDGGQVIHLVKDGGITIYEMSGSFEVAPAFAAWGSGSPAAHAVFHMGGDAMKAVEVAALVDDNIGGPFCFMRCEE